MDISATLILAPLLITGAGTMVWWVFRSSFARITSLEKALSDYKLHVAEHYVTSNELGKAIDAFNRSIDAVFSKLDRIEEKLDKKADK